MTPPYRPWGHLPFLLRHIRPRSWSLLGCLSTEERCVAARSLLAAAPAGIQYERWLEIDDGPNRFATQAAALRDGHRATLLAQGVSAEAVEQHTLFQPYGLTVQAVDRFLQSAGPDVVLDITSFPKRFFFPVLRRLLGAGQIRTLLVTYTDADRYGAVPLSEDPEPVAHLPLFAPRYPEPDVDALVIGLGFQPLGLAEILPGPGTEAVHLFFPYPQEAEKRYRVWEFVRGLAESLPVAARRVPTFVWPLDTPDVFDRLVELSGRMENYLYLAPFGPKPVSLAMALAASIADWPVYYTQPRVYRPDYTVGVRRVHGDPATQAYCVRLDGRDLYTRPN